MCDIWRRGSQPQSCWTVAESCWPVAASCWPVAARCWPVAASCWPVAASCGPIKQPVADLWQPVADLWQPVADLYSSQLLTCGSQLLTCSSQLLTCGSHLLTCGSKLQIFSAECGWNEPLHVPLVEYSSCVEMAPLRHLSFIPVIHSSYYLCSHTHTQQHSWSSGHRRATRKKLTLLSIHFLTTQPNIYHFPLSVFCACQFCQFLGPRNFPAWLRPYMTKAAEDKSWVGPGEEGEGFPRNRNVSQRFTHNCHNN